MKNEYGIIFIIDPIVALIVLITDIIISNIAYKSYESIVMNI